MEKGKGVNFIILALLAFLAIAMDGVLVMLIEPALYGAPWQEWTLAQNIAHYTIICAIWCLSGIILIRWAKNRYGFLITAKGEKLKTWQWVAVITAVLFMVSLNFYQWQGFKVVGEFHKKGFIIFLCQYIYYLFETLLFSLIIIFGQQGCELWFHKKNIPYGGIAAALTWGLGHILSKGSLSTGLFTALAGFIFGGVYLLVNRDFKKTILILYIMFAF